MTLARERLLTISGLKLADRLAGFNDALLDRYCGALAVFVENYPSIEADIKKALVIGDTVTLSRVLSELAEVLANIYADALVKGCETVRNSIDNADNEKLEAAVDAFLSEVGTLSVDIQMEHHKKEEESLPAARRLPAADADSVQKKSILAVDDIPVTLNMLRATLTEAGYKFSGVTSGVSALDFITKFTPDLFILDIEMPKMNGFELAEKIRRAGQAAPIIFLTGNTTREYLLRAIRAGAVDFIVKPLNADTIIAKIGKVFQYYERHD